MATQRKALTGAVKPRPSYEENPMGEPFSFTPDHLKKIISMLHNPPSYDITICDVVRHSGTNRWVLMYTTTHRDNKSIIYRAAGFINSSGRVTDWRCTHDMVL